MMKRVRRRKVREKRKRENKIITVNLDSFVRSLRDPLELCFGLKLCVIYISFSQLSSS